MLIILLRSNMAAWHCSMSCAIHSFILFHDLFNRKIQRLRSQRPLEWNYSDKTFTHSHRCVGIWHTLFVFICRHYTCTFLCVVIHQISINRDTTLCLQRQHRCWETLTQCEKGIWVQTNLPLMWSVKMLQDGDINSHLTMREALIWWLWHRTKTHN